MSGTFLFESSDAGYARVAVERAIDRFPEGLTYAIPEPLADLRPGERVHVPLGAGDKETAGYVVEIVPEIDVDPTRLKAVTRRDNAAVCLPADLLTLAHWVSRYYCAPIGMTLASMIPGAVKRNVGAATRRFVDVVPGAERPERIPDGQRRVLAAIDALPADRRPVEESELAGLAGVRTNGPIRRLVDHGLLAPSTRTRIEAAYSEQAVDRRVPDQLTPAQSAIIDSIASSAPHGFSTHLLYGVTGSGKTEVYIRLIRSVVDAGQVAIVLVPEIALTPQTAGRLVGRFPDCRVAILHSGMTAAQRHQQWALVASGDASIVLGARSAIFAPVPDGRIGLIIVDEEHDGSFKQDRAPRYHGRDVAIRRGQIAGCPVVLGSATPSLESWHNATVRGSYHLHQLTERAPGMKLPQVTVVDFAEERRRHHDRRVHLLGPVLEESMRRSLDRGGQSILLLNRRGYASYIACPDQMCGWVMTCDDCDVSVVFHRHGNLPNGGFVRCHHCDSEQRLPVNCPDCGRRIVKFGLGTQRVEEELLGLFPQLIQGQTMVRVDSDTMNSARDFHSVLGRFANREIHVLVGTQMIAKGLDFPGVDLVGVVNADTAINLPDFRASERTFQLVSQVAGRSGRSPDPTALGRVIVQSFNPEVPAITLAARHDYVSFARLELEERQQCGLPPFTRLTRLVIRDEDHRRCEQVAATIAAGLRPFAGENLRLRGPAPCPIARIAGRHRQQIELITPDAATMQRILTEARNAGIIRASAQLAIDVDPIALL